MKITRWIILALVLCLVGLLWTRQRNEVAGTPAPTTPSVEAQGQTPTPPPSAAPSETATATAPAGVKFPLPEAPGDANHLQVIVHNESGQPLAGAEVRAVLRTVPGGESLTNQFNRSAPTSTHGMANVLWPKQPFTRLTVTASKDNFGSRAMAWDVRAGDVIPPGYTFKLKAGVHIGGNVVDPEGSPVADATINLSRFWRGGEERPKSQGEDATFATQKHVTGADGRWTARNLPPELLERIMITASHSNYLGVSMSVDNKPEALQPLRDGTHRLELKRGLEVRGRVINEQQQPIADAQVWAGNSFGGSRQKTKSDEQGRFIFRNVRAGSTDYSVMATGYAPGAKSYNASNATEELVFKLGKGGIIRCLVQDEASQPIEGARVSLDGSLGEPYKRYDFSASTDRDGRFEWDSAPDKPIQFSVSKPGYQSKSHALLKPGEENVVTLRVRAQVQGQVLDAATGLPVKVFTITIGQQARSGRLYNSSYGGKEFRSEQGLFTVDLQDEIHNGIQATATDYSEQVLTLPRAGSVETNLVFRLKPSSPVEGIVVGTDGSPVPGASVNLVEGGPGGRSVQISRGKIQDLSGRGEPIITDASGRFKISSSPENGTIVASDGTAYGSATLAEVRASGVVTLRGFGRIEGTLIRGVSTAAGEGVFLSSPNTGIQFDFMTTRQTTDAEGRFTFETVPAGTFSIVRLVKFNGSWMHTHSSPVTVKAGETTQITLGGTDGTVHGQARFETAPEEKNYNLIATLSTALPQILDGLTPEQRRDLRDSPEWKERMAKLKNYSAIAAGDGALIFDTIPPGEYTMIVSAQERGSGLSSGLAFAQGTTTVTVPAGATPHTPIHFGEIILKPTK